MVNQWPGVPAKCLCNKHLNAVLSETTNLLLPSMRKGHSIHNYVKHGCIDIDGIADRVTECIIESRSRGYSWQHGEISDDDKKIIGSYKYDGLACDPNERAEMNKMILAFRCPECRKLIKQN